MKRKLSLILTAALILVTIQALAVSAMTEQKNYIQNSGFEKGSTGWTISKADGAEVSYEQHMGGSNSMKLISNGSYTNRVYQNITGLAAGNYTFQYYYYVTSDLAASSGTLGDSAGLRMLVRKDNLDGSPALYVKANGTAAVTGAWQKVTGTLTVPAGYDENTVWCVGMYMWNTSAGTGYVDDLKIYNTTTNLMLNGDFETLTGTGFTNWNKLGDSAASAVWGQEFTADNTIKTEGFYSLKLTIDSTAHPLEKKDIRYQWAPVDPLTAGEVYRVRFMLRVSNTSVTPQIRHQSPEDYNWTITLPSADTWYECSYYFKATTGVGGLRRIYAAIAQEGSAWLDDMRIEHVDNADVQFIAKKYGTITQTGDMAKMYLGIITGDTFKNGTTVGVFGAVSNSGSSAGAVMIAGCYKVFDDGTKRLCAINSTSNIQKTSGAPRMYCDVTIPGDTERYVLEAYVWDSLSGVIPICVGRTAACSAE